MSAVDQTITLQPVLPADPIVVCNSAFLHTLATVEREIANLKIDDAQSAQAAANIQQRLTKASKDLEDARTKLKAPFINKGREIDDAARAPAERLRKAKDVVANRLIDYQLAQKRAAEEAERARAVELARLEALRKAEEDAARKKSEEIAKSSAPAPEVLDFTDSEEDEEAPKTEIEKKIDEVKYAAPVAVARPVGVRFKTRLNPVVVDVNKIPEPFVTKQANLRAIIATFCGGWKEGDPLPACEGVRFDIERSVDSSGRNVF